MNVGVERINPEFRQLIFSKVSAKLSSEDANKFAICLGRTQIVFGGFYHDELKCIWGLITPTLLANEAYLWLHMLVEDLGECKFVFVRHSQRVIEELLTDYSLITGHCEIGNDRAIEWMRFLGAKFMEPEDGLVQFIIRRRTH